LQFRYRGSRRESAVAQLFSLGHFIMRNAIPILFIATTLLVGCHSPSMVSTQTAAPTPPQFHPLLITMLGTNTTSDGACRIVVSDRSLGLSHGGIGVSYPYPTGMIGIGSNTGWTTHAGWFVFVESDFKVWAYDGDRLLELDTYKPNGNGAAMLQYDSPRFPCAVPTDVFSRLSEPAQKVIQSHD
jgi:hypothetical protein